MTSRRKFIKNTSLAAAGALIAPMACKTRQTISGVSSKAMGVQVYSVRDALKQDFAGSMKKIADIGYKYIEAYGMGTDGQVFGMSPSAYKKVVADLGMEVVSCHASYFTPEQAPAIIESSKELGVKHLVVPYLSNDLRKDYYKVAENFNKVGEQFKGSGVEFCYHNHAFEFEKTSNGEIPQEILIENTQSDLVSFEADLYWIKKGGYDPLTFLRKYPGRFSLFHVKDAAANLDQTTVGEGIIDFQSIFNEKKKVGLKYYFIEDERTGDPFGNLQKAYDHINTLKI